MDEIQNDQEDIIEELPVTDEGQADDIDWKTLALRNQGIAKRLKTKLEKAREFKPEAQPDKKPRAVKSKEDADRLDLSQRAYLIAMGIKEKEGHDLALEMMKSTGRDLEDIAEDRFYLGELKLIREDKTLREATPPSSSGRSQVNPREDVNYWLAKGELPPNDNQKLRQEVVKAKRKALTDGNPFTDRPIG